MRRKLSLLVALVGVLGLLGLAPAAQADHAIKGDKTSDQHEQTPLVNTADLGGTCDVAGTVRIGNENNDGGVGAVEKNHNHYLFEETSITCSDTAGVGNDMSGYDGAHVVDAAGGTDGAAGANGHGEDDATGWSHSSCYDGTCSGFSYVIDGTKQDSFGDLYDGSNSNTASGKCNNCNEIVVDNNVETENFVMFQRELTTVKAWGGIVDTDNVVKGGFVCFVAELEFIPTAQADNGKTVEADLIGTAQIWSGSKADCGINNHGGKK